VTDGVLDTVRQALASLLLVVGALAMLLAALGLVRLPDLYTRMQAATKAGALGGACAMVAVALHFGDLGVATRAAVVVAFVFFTAPVSAHLIARAAYMAGVALWEGSVSDALRGRYDVPGKRLAGPAGDAGDTGLAGPEDDA
jgi:multicomponent Na+:H+ antiporter subunit G